MHERRGSSPQCDVNKEGFIPLGQLRQRIEMLGKAGDLSSAQLDRLVGGADVNGDKRVDFPEFCLMVRFVVRRFARVADSLRTRVRGQEGLLQMSKAKQMRMRQVMFRITQLLVPKSLREEQFSYMQQYTCLPPPLFLLFVTVIQVQS